MKVQVGDTVIDMFNREWLVFNISNEFIYCVDLKKQIQENGIVLTSKEIVTHITKPSNVEYMFLRRRTKSYEGIEQFL